MKLNQVFAAGRLTADPEIKYIQNGTAVVNVGLAVNTSYKQDEEWKERVAFVQIQAWGKTAELVKSFGKGAPVIVCGELRQDRWEKEGKKHSKIYIHVQKIVREDLPKKNGESTKAAAENEAGNPVDDEPAPF